MGSPKIAVLGVGAIGALVGGRLTLGGQDVTLRKGRELGVPTPTHDLVMTMLERIVSGEIQPGLEHLDELLERTLTPG